jgi:hypothetical protein
VALTTLLGRFPDLRLAVPEDQLQWKTGMAVRGPVALPIGWRGASAPRPGTSGSTTGGRYGSP